MKTIIVLCSVVILAAILAPTSTSNTTDQRRIAALEGQVAFLAKQADCIRAGIPVTNYQRAHHGVHYLAPTRRMGQKFMYVVVMTPSCMPRALQPQMLGWHW